MSALPPPFGEKPSIRVDSSPNDDLSARALREDPFGSDTLALDSGRYSPRHRLSSRPPPPYAPALGLPRPPSTGAAPAAPAELPFASARYPPGPNLALQGGYALGPAEPSLLPTSTAASSAFPPPPASTPLDAPPHPGHEPAPAPPAPWTQAPMQTYDLPLPAPRPASPTSTSAPAASVLGKRPITDSLDQPQHLHRRRQFKYLTDGPAPRANTNDAKPPDQHGSRKKVKRACVYCKRSHMPCDISRPCKRCVKRGIAHLCKDEPPTEAPGPRKRKDASAPPASTERRPSTESDRSNIVPPQAAQPAEGERKKASARMMLPISLLLTGSPRSLDPNSPERTRNSSPDTELGRTSSRASSNSDGRLPCAEQVDVNAEMQKLLGLIDPDARKLVEAISSGKDETTSGNHTSNETAQDSAEPAERLAMRTNAIQEEALTLAVMRAHLDETWTWGYTTLAQWMHENYTSQINQQLDSYVGKVREHYLNSSLSMTREQLQVTEEATVSGISHYRLNVFESVPHGMFIVSRTGRIMAVNVRLSQMVQLPSHLLSSGNYYYYYMISGPNALSVAKAYLPIATHSKKGKAADASAGATVENVNGMISTTLVHDFDIDRARTLKETPAWDYSKGCYLPDAPRELEDGTPAVVRFKGLVTWQVRIHEFSNGVPLFLVAYVSEWSPVMRGTHVQ